MRTWCYRCKRMTKQNPIKSRKMYWDTSAAKMWDTRCTSCGTVNYCSLPGQR